MQPLQQRLKHSAAKQHFSPPQITPQSSPDRHPLSQNRDPVSPRAAPTLGESPGDKLVEEADHPAQLPLAALLAVAHGSGSRQWGGTQPRSLPAAEQPPSSSGGALSLSSRSEPAGMGARSSPAERAAAAALPGTPGSAPGAAGEFSAGMLRCGWAEGQRDRRRCLSRGSGSPKMTAESDRGVRVSPPPGPCPPADPSVPQKLRGAASGRCGVPGSPAGPASPPAEADGRLPGCRASGCPWLLIRPLAPARPGTSRPGWPGTRGTLVWQPADSTGPADQ